MKGGRQTIAVTVTFRKCNKNSLVCQATVYWPSRKKEPYSQAVETCAKWNVVASMLLVFKFVPYWVPSISLLLFPLSKEWWTVLNNVAISFVFTYFHSQLYETYIYMYVIFFMEFNLLHYSSLAINHKFSSGTTISLHSTIPATCTCHVLYTNAWRW